MALQSAAFLRVFYQGDYAFEPGRFVDLPIKGGCRLAPAFDLDDDGCDELMVHFKTGEVRVYWGKPGSGLHADRFTQVAAAVTTVREQEKVGPLVSLEWVDAPPLAKVVLLSGKPHVFVARDDAVFFYPISSSRLVGKPLRIDCPNVYSVATADLDKDGFDELIFASRGSSKGADSSWIFWGGPLGFGGQASHLASQRRCL